MRPPSNPAHPLSTNRMVALQLCPVAMETWLLIFCKSLTLIRDRSCTVEKSMGHYSSKYTAVQQQEKKLKACLRVFILFVLFTDCGVSLVNLPLCRPQQNTPIWLVDWSHSELFSIWEQSNCFITSHRQVAMELISYSQLLPIFPIIFQ